MASFSGLIIGLTFSVGFIVMGIAAGYYLFYARRRIHGGEKNNQESKSSNGVSLLLRCRISRKTEAVEEEGDGEEVNPEIDLELGKSSDSLLKGLGEESVEAELMRLHNLCGPPRFLFTIAEETNEDLESQDGRPRNKSLSDLFTPMSSPPSKPLLHLDSYNPLFESSTDAEIHRLRSSPPPKFKFLRDAEEKLIKRLVEKSCPVQDFTFNPPVVADECKVGSFMSFLAHKSKESDLQHQHLPLHHSTPSQVLPLASSP